MRTDTERVLKITTNLRNHVDMKTQTAFGLQEIICVGKSIVPQKTKNRNTTVMFKIFLMASLLLLAINPK